MTKPDPIDPDVMPDSTPTSIFSDRAVAMLCGTLITLGGMGLFGWLAVAAQNVAIGILVVLGFVALLGILIFIEIHP